MHLFTGDEVGRSLQEGRRCSLCMWTESPSA